MTPRVALAALSVLAAGVFADPAAHPAVPTVEVLAPPDDTLASLTPTFTIAASGFDGAQHPVTLRFQVADNPLFTGAIVDTTLAGDTATVTLPRPLPDDREIFWRATARGSEGTTVTSEVAGPRFVRPWLRLIDPNVPVGVTLSNPRPMFVWSSAAVETPPGPWTYSFELLGPSSLLPLFTASGLVDTTFTPGFDLDFNASYRWRVTARLTTGDSVRVASAASFVIVHPRRPVATLLYQNFPNPFPRGVLASTCIWFDLREPATVRLEIFDIRANRVRQLVPSPAVPALMPAGRYGRALDSGGGCDPLFAWDGADDHGRPVAAGVYLLRLTADGQALTKKIVFRGR
ncbi:MAG TPA: hypothetical protein VMM77_06725 [Gemmatimonadaceae bacterium]|nr:hypothetical protein [Gemmatimonadaceae bacterium]